MPSAPVDATVSIVDGAGNTAEKTVSIRYADPGAPALTDGTSPNADGLFGLGWSGSDPATSGVEYALQHRDADDPDWSDVDSGLAQRAFAFSGAGEAEGTWTYRVQGSHDGDLTTAWSGASDAVKVDRTAPNAPALTADRAPDYAGDSGWYRDTVSVSYAGNGDPALAGRQRRLRRRCRLGARDGDRRRPTARRRSAGPSRTTSATRPARGPSASRSTPPTRSWRSPVPTAVLLHASASATYVAADGESGLAADPSGHICDRHVDRRSEDDDERRRPTTSVTSSTKSCTTQVQYMYGGLQQPVNVDGSSIFKLGSAVPLKFQLTDYSGAAGLERGCDAVGREDHQRGRGHVRRGRGEGQLELRERVLPGRQRPVPLQPRQQDDVDGHVVAEDHAERRNDVHDAHLAAVGGRRDTRGRAARPAPWSAGGRRGPGRLRAMDDLRIRPLDSAEDAAAFQSLNEEWIARFFVVEEQDRRQLDDPIAAYIDTGGQILIAESAGRRVGCVALVPDGSGAYELSKMAVAPDQQGRGTGRRLLAAAIDHARAAGATSIFLG